MSDAPPSLLNRNLLVRIFSSLALIPVVLGAVWVGDWAFFILILLVSGLSMREWMALTAPNHPAKAEIVILFALVIVVLAAQFKGPPQAIALMLLASLLLGVSAARTMENRTRSNILWAVVGFPYVTLSALSMGFLRQLPEHGLALTLYLLLVVWGTDTGAYFAGRMIGGPKLLPKISPKKTWAGLIGGMAFAAAMGYAVALWFEATLVWQAAVLAAVLALVAQAGDFLESYVKRRAGAKDSGTLIPGHGGMLDRVDGLLAAALALGAFVRIWNGL
ncbi:MAG: phosphatidate cytidylyltransferase [Bdellovibrionales bacterium]